MGNNLKFIINNFLTVISYEFSFSPTSCHLKARNPSLLYNWPVVRGSTDEFMWHDKFIFYATYIIFMNLHIVCNVIDMYEFSLDKFEQDFYFYVYCCRLQMKLFWTHFVIKKPPEL